MVDEISEALAWDSSDIALADFTVGGGGHLAALLEKFPQPKKILAVDQDLEALVAAKKRLADFENIEFFHGNFRRVPKSKGPFDRVVIDLGVSSYQLDNPERGFSFQKDGPLDMRMNPLAGEAAWEWLAHCDESELVEVLRDLGDEPRARPLAKRWIEKRREGPKKTIREFVEALGSSLEAKNPQGKHPLTRVFQAIRMQVNDELGSLIETLENLPDFLRTKARVAILTFHSLEDRTVKWELRGKLRAINKKVICASEEEQAVNPRSRSAKLRIFEK